MATYLNKLRRLSKQPEPLVEQKTQGPSKVQDPTAAGPSEPAKSPPVPTVTEPSEETGVEPILDDEDEKFLERLAAIAQEPEGAAPPLPMRPVEVIDDNGEKKIGRDAQEALMDGADKVALPMSPQETAAEVGGKGKEKAKGAGLGRTKSVMSYFTLPKFKKGDKEKETVAKDKKEKEKVTEKDRAQFADDLHAAAEAAKAVEMTDAQREDKELAQVLDQLNLSAVNNRVFSFSKESEELLNKFTLVLKDIVNGVPTAYNDLEKLFTDYEGQLKKMYGSLPPFLQNMVKGLPAKLTATLGPELLAASAEKPGFDAQQVGGSKSKRSKIPSIPSLKQLVTAQGAVATALKSIVNFLRFRFPALAVGTNLIMSLAVCLLLFVFWYCHKRGRETRLEKERLAAESVDSARASSASSINDDNDSIFGEKPKPGAHDSEVPTKPLVIGDGKENGEKSTTVDDLPSVAHLPDPKSGEVPETKELPLRK